MVKAARYIITGFVVLVMLGLLFLLINWPIQSMHTAKGKVEPENRAIAVPGGTLNVRVAGHGPPLLLIHGWRSSLHWWDSVAPTLERRYTVIAPDLLGFGESDKPCPGYGMNQQAGRVIALLDELKIRKVQVVGHSMGGVVASAMAERYPTRVESVTIVGSPAGPGEVRADPTQNALLQPLVGPALETLANEPIVKSNMKATAFAPGTKFPDRLVTDAIKPTWCSAAHSHKRATDFIEQQDLGQRLTAYGGPVLAIYGAKDGKVNAQRAVATIKQDRRAKIVVLRGSGHTPMYDQRDRFMAHLEPFLARQR